MLILSFVKLERDIQTAVLKGVTKDVGGEHMVSVREEMSTRLQGTVLVIICLNLQSILCNTSSGGYQ